MPTDQPSSAPQADPPQQTEELTAAAVLHDDMLDQPAGGGGMGAPTGAGAVPGPGRGAAALSGDATAAEEARVQAVRDDPPEPGHASR